MKKKNIYITLATVFFKLGLFTFGGGYAMLPLIHREAVERYNWIDDAEMLDILAVAESTPGPVIINTATFVGYKMARFWGSVVATFSVSLPSFVIILIISYFYTQFRANVWVTYAFNGINAAVGLLIIKSLLKLAKQLKGQKSMLFTVGIAVTSFSLMAFLHIKAVYVIVFAAAAGIVFFAVGDKKAGGDCR